MFQHYLITRFNLKKEGWNLSKNNIPVLTEEWLERRFKLFESFCFPSVKHQSNQNFTWLVYFDVDTPKTFKDRILGLSLGYPKFQPRFVENMQAFVPAIQEELSKVKPVMRYSRESLFIIYFPQIKVWIHNIYYFIFSILYYIIFFV